MVGSWGMTGRLSSLDVAPGVPGRSGMVGRVLADDAGREAVEAILARARDDVRKLLAARPGLVAALRDALLERDELIGNEITAILGAAEAQVAGGLPAAKSPSLAAPVDAPAPVIDLREGSSAGGG